MSKPAIFLLGATGYVGGEVLVALASQYPDYPLTALIRNASTERVSQLQAIHPKIVAVEGDITDSAIVEEQAKKADIVINVALGGHLQSISATLEGLRKRSSSKPDNPPLYIHMSGTGITGDGANGELLTPEKIWKDTEFKLSDCHNPALLGACLEIAAAGIDKQTPIRTIIVMPGLVYGVGAGLQKISLAHRLFVNLAKAAGQAGTFGAGRNVANDIHLKDVGSAVTTVLKAALAGTADEGENGFYFVVSKNLISMQNYAAIIGDVLHKNGAVQRGGSQPLPQAVADSVGVFGSSVFGGSTFCKAERLAKLGWSPEYSEKTRIFDSLPEEIEVALKEV